jgi:hypothetical protein
VTPLMRCLAGYWRLDADLSTRFWRALCRARWSETVAWRHALVHFDHSHRAVPPVEAVEGFISRAAKPAVVLRVLELLTQERCLSQQAASRIGECVLGRVDKHGHWY